MKIIINADDFGYDADTVAAVIDGISRGAITSASLMANMPATTQAIAFARSAAGVSFGVHLTFARDTIEAPLTSSNRVACLVDSSGAFLSPGQLRLRALSKRLSVDQIALEAHEQIGYFVDNGIHLSHVDSHHHTHLLPPFRLALMSVLPRFGIKKVRTAKTLRIRTTPWRASWWTGASAGLRMRRSFSTTKHFVMLDAGYPSAWWQKVRRELEGEGTLEFGCHPGIAEGWRRREFDEALSFAAWCKSRGHPLITWNDT